MAQTQWNIGIDGNEANVVNRVGSNVYAFEIISALQKISSHRSDISWTIFLSSPPVDDLPKKTKYWKYKVIKPHFLATQWALPLYLWKERRNFSVFFTPGHYAPRACPVPYVSTVMDLAFLKFPNQFKLKDLYQLKNWTKYSIKNARHVIAISQSTKNDIVERYGLPTEKISVAYPALSLNSIVTSQNQKQILKKFDLHHPFLLYVGTLQPRKNLVRLIKAFENLLDEEKYEKSGIELVIAGKTGWLANDIVQAAKKSRFTERIRLLGYVTEEEKNVLYQKTVAVVLVGLYEGFGMPPLEALSYKKVSLVSNTSSLPEVVGKTGILVDPYSVEDILKGMKKAIKFAQQKNEFWEKSVQNHLQKFNWENSAHTILEVLLQ